jgi:hypothetical protein
MVSMISARGKSETSYSSDEEQKFDWTYVNNIYTKEKLFQFTSNSVMANRSSPTSF